MLKYRQKSPEADLKGKYQKALEAATGVALIILIFSFYAFKKFEVGTQLPESVDIKIEVVDIPLTEQLQKPPPPSRPSIPVESEDEDLLDDVTIEETEVVFEARDDAPPPPPPEDDEIFEFYAVSEKPVLTKQAAPVYPELARRAQIEGWVVVTVTIDEKGKVIDAKIFKSIPMLDDAAIAAALKCTFKPAKQRDKFVKVKMNLPFQFKLRG